MAGSDESGQAGASALAMSPAQSRAARGLLGWSEADLAAKVGLDEQFVRDFESGYGDPPSGQIEACAAPCAPPARCSTTRPIPASTWPPRPRPTRASGSAP